MSSTDSRIVHAEEEVTKLIRELGALERLTYRYGERNPVHFSILAEFDVVLGAVDLQAALLTVQKRHPLLTVHVKDDPVTRLGFYRAPRTAPIPLQVRDGCRWQTCAAEELVVYRGFS
jgi:hypothetical protein